MQARLGIKDTAQVFEADTMKSACGLQHPEAPPYTGPLAKVRFLCNALLQADPVDCSLCSKKING